MRKNKGLRNACHISTFFRIARKIRKFIVWHTDKGSFHPVHALFAYLCVFAFQPARMYIIVIAWIYVVFMMAITETSVVAGIMTFLLYGLLPVAILVYLMDSGRRRRKRKAEEMQRREEVLRQTEAQSSQPPQEN